MTSQRKYNVVKLYVQDFGDLIRMDRIQWS